MTRSKLWFAVARARSRAAIATSGVSGGGCWAAAAWAASKAAARTCVSARVASRLPALDWLLEVGEEGGLLMAGERARDESTTIRVAGNQRGGELGSAGPLG